MRKKIGIRRLQLQKETILGMETLGSQTMGATFCNGSCQINSCTSCVCHVTQPDTGCTCPEQDYDIYSRRVGCPL